MGCKCKDKQSKSPVIESIKYIFCPQCNIVTPKRLPQNKLVGYKCEVCQSKTASFVLPPSQNKLKLIKQRMGM